jgi:hypothetical protein
MPPIDTAELRRRFGFHPADTDEKRDDHAEVRAACKEAAGTIIEITGAPSREQSLAITKLEEAMMWANADIARKGASA